MNSSHDRARSLTGVGMVLAAAALFAVNGSVSKLVLEAGLSPLRLVELRCVAAAALFALIAALRSPASLRIGPRELVLMAAYGIVGVAMVQWLYLVAIGRMPVSVSLLIEFSAPVLVALWVRYVRKEPVHRRIWGALALVVAGLALVAQIWAGLTLDGVGLLAACLAAVSLAAYYLLGEHGLGARDPLSLAAWSFALAGAFWSVLLPWWSFPFDRLTATTTIGAGGPRVGVGVLMAWVVLLGTVVPFGLGLLGLGRIGATRVGLIGTAEPPLAGLVAWIVLGETLTPVQVLGGAVVLAGILLAETARHPTRAPNTQPTTTGVGGSPGWWRLSVGGARVNPPADDGVGGSTQVHRRVRLPVDDEEQS